MKKASKYLGLFLITCLIAIASGCARHNAVIETKTLPGQSFFVNKPKAETVKLRNGVVIYRDDFNYKSPNSRNSFNFNGPSVNVNFGPKSINFGPEKK